MKHKVVFFLLGFFTASYFTIIACSYYDIMTHGLIDNKTTKFEDFDNVVRELVINEVTRQNYKFSDCFENLGFKDLKRLYVYIDHDNSIQSLDDFIRVNDIQKLFENQFNSYEIFFLYDRNVRPWKDVKDIPYATVYIDFSLYDKSRHTVSSSVKILYMTMSYQRNDQTYPRAGMAYLTPVVWSKDEMSAWFKQSINEFARYRATYMQFSCL